MSILVNISKCTEKELQKLETDLSVYIPQKDTRIDTYRVQHNLVWIPYYYGVMNGYKAEKSHTSLNNKFIGVLRPEQKIVRDEAITRLNRYGSIVLSTHVGFGKSILATYLAYKTKKKTLIIVNRLVLIEQWIGVLNQFIENPKVCVMKPSQVIDEDADFFITNAINVPKYGFLSFIGTLIVDEVHLIVSNILCKCLQYICPEYSIALSATPYRPDGLDILIDLYFGEYKIIRNLNRKHYFYRVNTGFKPKVERQMINNKIDWNSILNQQATESTRNQLIVDIIKREPRNFLVLCKRVEQITLLETMLKEDKSIECTSLYGNKQPTNIENIDKRIVLIGTIQKVGTGFDAPYLNGLIIASDIEEYFIQYLGRVFRKQDTIPVIYDFVDNNNILVKHYKTREQTYLEHGGEEKKFYIN